MIPVPKDFILKIKKNSQFHLESMLEGAKLFMISLVHSPHKNSLQFYLNIIILQVLIYEQMTHYKDMAEK